MQKKIRLAVEELAVLSFETEQPGEERGTVDAYANSGIGFTCKSCLTNITCCTPRF
ncbi:MAG TPA: hypothetical protein VF092_06900 [Longimicrobium sp.]